MPPQLELRPMPSPTPPSGIKKGSKAAGLFWECGENGKAGTGQLMALLHRPSIAGSRGTGAKRQVKLKPRLPLLRGQAPRPYL